MPSARDRSSTVGTRKPRRGPLESIHTQVSRACSSRGPRRLPEHRMSHPPRKCSGMRPLMTPARSATVPVAAGLSARYTRCAGPYSWVDG
eukprot:11555166-Alexandrium_andersonii.AAC.2